jgi:hypothetical protein
LLISQVEKIQIAFIFKEIFTQSPFIGNFFLIKIIKINSSLKRSRAQIALASADIFEKRAQVQLFLVSASASAGF